MEVFVDILKIIAGALVTLGSVAGARYVYKRGREDLDEQRAVRDAARDTARWDRMDKDLDDLRKEVEEEREARKSAEREFYAILNGFRIRDSVWFGFTHDLQGQIVVLGGIPKDIPEVLKKLPSYPITDDTRPVS